MYPYVKPIPYLETSIRCGDNVEQRSYSTFSSVSLASLPEGFIGDLIVLNGAYRRETSAKTFISGVRGPLTANQVNYMQL